MLGSVCHPDARVRQKAVDHLLECVDVMDATGSRDLKLWFADGTNYPGQDDIRARQDRLAESLRTVYDRLGPTSGSSSSTSCSSRRSTRWTCPTGGPSLVHCVALGPKAKVVVDTGHHAPGTNIEFIVASLLRLDKLGGFDFNSRFYADDDLMVGSADPFQLFRIMHECVKGGALDAESGVAFMLDQCHNIEPKIPGQIRSRDERPGGDREGAARRPRGARGGPGRGRRAGRERDPHGRLRHRRPAAPRRPPPGHGPRPGPDRAPTPAPATPSGSRRSGSAATRRDGAHEHRGPHTRPGAPGPVAPAGRGPAQHELRRRQHVGEGLAVDPVTGSPVELLWVKGSGGDLGTLTEAGLAVLRLDRLRALVDVYPGVEREDEMVGAFDYCLFGKGGAAPSIDTAMHGLVESTHVDHLHPDSGIAFATAADGEALTRALLRRSRRVGPLAPARVPAGPRHRGDPGRAPGGDRGGPRRPRRHRLGRHLRRRARRTRSRSSARPRRGSTSTAGRIRSARPIPDYEPLPAAERRARAAALLPVVRGLASTDHPQVGCYTDSEVVLDFLSREAHPRLAALGTSCPDHFLRTKVRPMVLDLPPTAPIEDAIARLRELHAAYRDEYRAYYERHAEPDSPAMRGADPAIVLVPGVGMFSFGATRRPPASPASSTSTRSTSCAAPRPSRPTRRSRKPRSSGSSTGRSRRRSSGGCRRRSRSRRGSRS